MRSQTPRPHGERAKRRNAIARQAFFVRATIEKRQGLSIMAEKKTAAPCPASGEERREHFLYLGFQSKVHFFLHVLYAERTLELLVEMCRDIFDYMSRDKMLEKDDAVVVFNIPVGWKETVIPVEIHHAGAPQTTFHGNELAETFMKLLAADRSKNPSQLVAEVVMCAGKAQEYTFHDYPSFTRKVLIPPAKAPKFEEIVYGFSTRTSNQQ